MTPSRGGHPCGSRIEGRVVKRALSYWCGLCGGRVRAVAAADRGRSRSLSPATTGINGSFQPCGLRWSARGSRAQSSAAYAGGHHSNRTADLVRFGWAAVRVAASPTRSGLDVGPFQRAGSRRPGSPRDVHADLGLVPLRWNLSHPGDAVARAGDRWLGNVVVVRFRRCRRRSRPDRWRTAHPTRSVAVWHAPASG